MAAALCALAVPILAVLAFGPLGQLDLRILLHLRSEAGPRHALAAILVNLGDLAALLLLGAAIGALGWKLGRRREVFAALVVVAGANLTTQLLKATVEHVRARALAHDLYLPWPNSFPSGHTTAAASLAAALLLVTPARHRLAAATIGAALTAAVGFSVVVLGWHYPSDALGALLVVGAWGFAALAYLRLRSDRDRDPMRAEGLEPPRAEAHQDLNLARIPIPPRPLGGDRRA